MSQHKPVNASARVRLVIDVPVGDTWGSACTVEQIHAQAHDAALAMLRRTIATRPARDGGTERPIAELGALIDSGHARVIDYEVTTILVTEKRP